MKKFIRDDEVAVLISPGFGAGWSTWNYSCPECLFDPEIVQMVLDNKPWQEIANFADAKYETETNYFYSGGASDLVVRWVPVGTKFRVHEYDGSETLEIKEELDWIEA